MSVLRLLPAPERPYAALKKDLVQLGWQWANEAQVLPLLPGEPEWVEYRHASGGKLRYEYNPAIGLREIEVEAPPEQLAGLATLPQLDAAGVVALLGSERVEALLRGLFAARALRLMAVLGRVHALTTHPDELVRRTASDVAQTLPVLAVREAWERLQALREARPERSVLLESMPVTDRRQVLRWMGADRKRANAYVLAALRSGLADADAEVRATAGLVAARLDARELVDAVRSVDVPARFADTRAIAVAALTSDVPLRPLEPHDDGSLLLHALLEPLPAVPPPPSLPRHLHYDGTVVRLARSGLEVALVPSLPHWLGRPDDAEAPLRRVVGRAFAIAVAPLDARAARALGLTSVATGTLELSFEDAVTWAKQLGILEGITMRLPDAAEWEMAMRGPDGRRFAAGQLVAEPTVSPWGLAALETPEWLADGTVRTGADPSTRCVAAPGVRYAARFVMAFPM